MFSYFQFECFYTRLSRSIEEEEEEEEIILFDTYLSIVTDNIYKVNRTTVSGDYN